MLNIEITKDKFFQDLKFLNLGIPEDQCFDNNCKIDNLKSSSNVMYVYLKEHLRNIKNRSLYRSK